MLGNHCMPVCSPPEGKKIGGDSMMESPLDLFKWVDKVCLYTALYLNCCTANTLTLTLTPNSQYHWDKSCGPIYQLYTHRLLHMCAQLEPKILMDHFKLDTVCVHYKSLLTMRTDKPLSDEKHLYYQPCECNGWYWLPITYLSMCTIGHMLQTFPLQSEIAAPGYNGKT